MRRTRKGTFKRVSRSYKRTSKRSSKRSSKRVARKQSGGEFDMKLFNSILKQRSHVSNLAGISSEKAKKFKEQINLL